MKFRIFRNSNKIIKNILKIIPILILSLFVVACGIKKTPIDSNINPEYISTKSYKITFDENEISHNVQYNLDDGNPSQPPGNPFQHTGSFTPNGVNTRATITRFEKFWIDPEPNLSPFTFPSAEPNKKPKSFSIKNISASDKAKGKTFLEFAGSTLYLAKNNSEFWINFDLVYSINNSYDNKNDKWALLNNDKISPFWVYIVSITNK